MSDHAFRGTPFHSATLARSESPWWYAWGGYVVPDVYLDLHSELHAIRNNVAMLEMSPVPKMKITGADAKRFVNYLVTRDSDKMEVGYAWYTTWCNEDGKVIADGIAFYFEENHFVLSGDRSTLAFKAKAESFDVEITDITDDYGILALQGPKSRQVLESVTGEDWSDLKFSRIRTTTIAGVELAVTRTGFTGEHGYELWVQREHGAAVWQAVAEAGQPFDIRPAGEYAIDIARVEAGLILVSADYAGAGPDKRSSSARVDESAVRTPYELGLGHCVKLDKPADFIGKQALTDEYNAGPAREMVGLEFDAREIAELFLDNGMAPDVSPRVRRGYLDLKGAKGETLGCASSVTWSPTSKRLIGFGCVLSDFTAIGTTLTVQWADIWGKLLGDASAKIVEMPFIDIHREN